MSANFAFARKKRRHLPARRAFCGARERRPRWPTGGGPANGTVVRLRRCERRRHILRRGSFETLLQRRELPAQRGISGLPRHPIEGSGALAENGGGGHEKFAHGARFRVAVSLSRIRTRQRRNRRDLDHSESGEHNFATVTLLARSRRGRAISRHVMFATDRRIPWGRSCPCCPAFAAPRHPPSAAPNARLSSSLPFSE